MTEQAPGPPQGDRHEADPSWGEDARRNNARTGGSVKLEHVTLDKIDGNGLAFTCSVKRRAGGFGGGFSTEDETTPRTGAICSSAAGRRTSARSIPTVLPHKGD